MRWNPDLMTPLWKGLFGSSIAPAAGEVSTYCCSHFVLSRDRALLRPRRFYENAVKFVMSPESYFYLPSKWSPARQRRAADFDMRGRVVCQNMMFLWHIFFGEPLELPHRMYDPSLPLFLKTRNIRTAYMDDDGLWPQKDVKKRGFKDVQIQSTTLAWCWSVVWYVSRIFMDIHLQVPADVTGPWKGRVDQSTSAAKSSICQLFVPEYPAISYGVNMDAEHLSEHFDPVFVNNVTRY